MALRNILHICPSLGRVLVNIYQTPFLCLLMVRSCCQEKVLCRSQGDLLAMTMFTVATIPLINELRKHKADIWYADDASNGGSVENVRKCWYHMAQVMVIFLIRKKQFYLSKRITCQKLR